MPAWGILGEAVLFLAQATAPASQRLSQAWLLAGVLVLLVAILGGLAVLTVVRRMALRDVNHRDRGVAKSKRVPRSAWSEAGRRAVPIETGESEEDSDDEERP